jgi:hypothetical protein
MGPTALSVAVERREICDMSVNLTPCRPPLSLVSERTAIIGCPVPGLFDAINVPQIEQNKLRSNKIHQLYPFCTVALIGSQLFTF